MNTSIRIGLALTFAALSAGALCSATAGAQGRDGRSVQPERPTVATHAGTVRPGFLEMEWGVDYSDGPTLYFPTYFKLGLSSRTQFGLLLPMVQPSGGDLGFGDMMIALKWRLVDNNPLLGDFAIQPGVSLPTSDGSSDPSVSFILISSRMLGSVALDLNAGVTAGKGRGSEAMWTVSLGGPMSGKWGWVGELSGAEASGATRTQLLLGPTYRVRRWFSLDGGVILPLKPATDLRLYFGGVTNFGRIVGK